MRRSTLFLLATLWASVVVSGQIARPVVTRNHPAIAYGATPVDDPIARLDRRVKSGEVSLEFREGAGYLQSVLRALAVPVESQLLVFSKTSFQAPRIHPGNPRALYFNDATAVGWVRGGEVLEFIGQDARQGAVFYTLPNTQTERPRFTRNTTCVLCHSSDGTENVPGMFVGSVYPSPDGTGLYGPAYMTDHRSPLAIRWGGWYVTGEHGAERHLGNAVATDPSDLAAMVTPQTVHVANLQGRFDATGYLSTESDVVALLTLEHQATMLNMLTRLGWEARVGLDAAAIARTAAAVADYMLFVEEAPLPGPLRGASGFAAVYQALGPRDRQGRSLRDVDLRTRLFRYPCSPLIYSESFDALPEAAKSALYDRLWTILSGAETTARYARLTIEDRPAILDILRDTKPNLPQAFH